MLGGYNHEAMFVDEMGPERLGILSGVNKLDDRVFGNTTNEGYAPAFLEDYDHNYDTVDCDENFEGMIFMSNRQTKKECIDRELFGLPISQASVVKRVKPGMKLFLFEYERRQLYGVFEATSSGVLNIDRNAFKTSGGSFPAQVRIKTVWECNPLSEEDFRDAIYENYYTSKKFHFYLSQEQVLELIRLFSSRKIESQVLKGPDCLGSNQDLREKLDQQHKKTMLLQEVGSNLSARKSDFTNIEEDEIYYTKDSYAGQGMGGVLDSQQRLSLYSSEQPNFAASFEQRLAMQSAQERNVSSNCEQRFALHSARQCNLSSSCEQRVALHSAQQPNVCSVEQMHALLSVEQPIFSSGFEQGLAAYSVQHPNVSSSVDVSNSAFQPSYMRRYPISEENYLVAGDVFTNGIKMSEEMDSTNGRDLYIPSNYRHYDSLYFNESAEPHVPLSLNSIPGTHAMPFDERPRFERQELSQAPLNNSPVNHNNGSLFSHKDIFPDDLPSKKVMEHPKRPVLRAKPCTAAMSSLRSDNCTQKPSVFTRLSRVPENDVSHDREHEDMVRHSHVAKSNGQQYPQKLLRSLGKRPEILGGAHDGRLDGRLDIEVRDRPAINDGIATNHKQRSKASNAGKESNKRVEAQTKSVHDSLDSLDSLDTEVTDEYTVNDGMVINFKRRSETCKAVKESNLQVESQNKSNDGEPNPHRPKRRKLIRPEFNIPKLIRPEFNIPVMSQTNILLVSLPDSADKCHVETKVLTESQNYPSTNTFLSVPGLLDPDRVSESEGKCPVESKNPTQPENDASATSIITREWSVESKNSNQPEKDACPNSIVTREWPIESKNSNQQEKDACPNSIVTREWHVESKNSNPENDASANSIVTREWPVESKNSNQPEKDACPNSIVTREWPVESKISNQPEKDACPNSIVTWEGHVESKNSNHPEKDACPNPIVTWEGHVENKNSNHPEKDACPNPIVTSVIDLVGPGFVLESVEEYPVGNKVSAQTVNDVSTNSIANKSTAGLVDSLAVTDQEIHVANPRDAEEK